MKESVCRTSAGQYLLENLKQTATEWPYSVRRTRSESFEGLRIAAI